MTSLTNDQLRALNHLHTYRAEHPMDVRYFNKWQSFITLGNAPAVEAWCLPLDMSHCLVCSSPFTHGGSDYCTYSCELEHAEATPLDNLEEYHARYSIGPRYQHFRQQILMNQNDMVSYWSHLHAYHCRECGAGFDDPEVTRHENYCSEQCFQSFWDWQDSLPASAAAEENPVPTDAEEEVPEASLAEVEETSTPEQEVPEQAEEPSYDSRANIASIQRTIQAASPFSEERLSYIHKLFICLTNEDRALLHHENFRAAVVRKIEEFNGTFLAHPDLPLRREIFTAMNRCRAHIDSILGIARA